MSGLIPEVVTLNKPYVLTSDQILYVEKEYCPEINSFITGHYSELCGIFRISAIAEDWVPFPAPGAPKKIKFKVLSPLKATQTYDNDTTCTFARRVIGII